MNSWLTPFTEGEDHTISINLNKRGHSISMIRIWNYNKSRIHSCRGARYVTISMDQPDNFIFKGEIKKAPGHVGDPAASCEVILFTNEEAVLHRIAREDWVNDI